MRNGAHWINQKDVTELIFRLPRVVGTHQRHAQIEMGSDQARLKRYGSAKFPDSACDIAFSEEGTAQVIMCLGKVGLRTDGLSEFLNGNFFLAQLPQNSAQVVVGVGK